MPDSYPDATIVPFAAQTYAYTEDDFDYPLGLTARDMDWTLFTWDIRLPDVKTGHPREWIRFVVAPGVFFAHTGTKRQVWRADRDWSLRGELDFKKHFSPNEGAVAFAAYLMEFYLTEKNYQWENMPMILTVNRDDYPEWSVSYEMVRDDGVIIHNPINTLGDAMVWNGDRGQRATQDVMILINDERKGMMRNATWRKWQLDTAYAALRPSRSPR